MNRKPIIGVNFFPNTRLKGKKINKDGSAVRKYPVYVTVTFEQKTSQAKVLVDDKALFVSADEDWKNKGKVSQRLKTYDKKIREVIRYEKAIIGEHYSITMLSKRFSVYELPFEDFLKEINLLELLNYKAIISNSSFGRIGFLNGIVYLREKLAQKTVYQVLLKREGTEELLHKGLASEDRQMITFLIEFIYNLMLSKIFTASEFEYDKFLTWSEISSITN
jgi:hypothetical protein